MAEQPNFVEVINRLLEMGVTPKSSVGLTPGGVQYAVIPVGYKVESLEKLQFSERNERPQRIETERRVFNPQSFTHYFERFADQHSLILASRELGLIVGRLDYHEGPDAPRWQKHVVALELCHTEEWKTWTGANKKQMDQEDLSEFIEDNTPDIVDPSAATMLEVAESIKVTKGLRFDSAIRTSNGQQQITYHEDINGVAGKAGKMSIPERFTIRLAVYEGMEPIELTARFRYRLTGGKLTLWYDLLRVEAAKRAAFLEVCRGIEASCGRPVLQGKVS